MSQPSTERTDGNARTLGLTETERYELLADRRRRLALEILDGTATRIELEKLAAEIATREDDGDVATDAAVERVAVALHHKHLPKLADYGVVDYEPAVRLITPADDSAGSIRTRPLADD